MRTSSLILGGLVVAATTACGNYAPEDVAFLRGAPRLVDVALQPPGAELAEGEMEAAAAGEVEQALSSCDEAPLRCMAQQTARDFNGLTGGLIAIIDGVINNPWIPMRRYPHRRVWGPLYVGQYDATQDNTVRFEVVKNPDAAAEHPFTFCLHVVRGRIENRLANDVSCEDADAVDPDSGLRRVLHGGLSPGDDPEAQAATGAGRLILDGVELAIATEDDEPDIPAIFDIEYDHSGGSELIHIDIRDVMEEVSEQFTSAEYDYVRLQEGSGEFAFKVKGQLVPSGLFEPQLLETFEIKAQWSVEKAGAARAQVYGGNLDTQPDGPQVWDVEECWDTELDTVYFLSDDPEKEPVGTVDLCQVPLPPAM